MSIAEAIRSKVEELPIGQPFTAAMFFGIAERSNIDKTLGRLVEAGVIVRASRGVYARPKQSRFGVIPPEITKMAALKAQGEPVAMHGAEALRQLGLSTQVPVSPVFYTTARSKSFKTGAIEVRLQQVSPRKMVHAGTKVGMALSALWYLGKESVDNSVFDAIRSKLNSEEYATFRATVPQMPGWMAQALLRYENGEAHACVLF